VRLVAQQAAQDADATPTLPVVPLKSSDTLEDGEEVIINKKGIPWFGSPATVVKSSRNQVPISRFAYTSATRVLHFNPCLFRFCAPISLMPYYEPGTCIHGHDLRWRSMWVVRQCD
jgi:hypothetical protein